MTCPESADGRLTAEDAEMAAGQALGTLNPEMAQAYATLALSLRTAEVAQATRALDERLQSLSYRGALLVHVRS